MNRMLVITPERHTVRMIRACVIAEWPGAEVLHHVPAESPLPTDGADLAAYDALLLDYELGVPGENGLDWLERLRDNSGGTPIIMVTDEGDPQIAVRAIKRGADDYLSHEELSPERLSVALTEALASVTGSFGTSAGSTGLYFSHSATALPGSDTERDVTRVLASDEMPAASEAAADSVLAADGALEVPQVRPEDTGVLHLPGREALRVPGYQIEKMLGAGAMAKVFIAKRLRDGLDVAFKVLDVDDDQDPAVLRRFMREYRILRELRHPNVIRIFTRVLAPNYVCLVMEYCEGGDLGAQLPGGISPSRAMTYLRAIAAGLAAGHERGIIHRDVKPGNILFRADGSLAVADFGAASQFGEDHLTQAGAVVGTPYYLSPEQLRGEPASERTDLYSLGVLFYEMLTGERPYVSRRLLEIIEMHQSAPVPTLPDACKRLQPVLDRLMAKDPARRPKSAAALATAIRART